MDFVARKSVEDLVPADEGNHVDVGLRVFEENLRSLLASQSLEIQFCHTGILPRAGINDKRVAL